MIAVCGLVKDARKGALQGWQAMADKAVVGLIQYRSDHGNPGELEPGGDQG